MIRIDTASDIQHRLAAVEDRIRRAAHACGRNPAEISLVGATKTVSRERLVPAIDAGLVCCGENYVQEAREKIAALPPEYRSRIAWHFIGRLQTNKARDAVRLFDLIHSVDSLKLAQALDRQAAAIGKVQAVLIQVNIAGEKTKSGVPPSEAPALVKDAGRLDHLAVKGLMTIPPYFDAPEKSRPFFKALCELKHRILEAEFPGIALDTLSMGMTGDFEAAIAEGATMVRIGTAIFGERP